ncbi:histidine kinase [Luteolibacter pohnpeiensis]|uniref:histidine kinase n=1 Tax=Luteolibacter pohnpeiensis TaxID=454153 RepID=A0A934S9Y7_9BACT|nr:histidine kinase [Luteolibacter pohnpeiensis]MBK1884085.1 histidine kinase [Luteolibacter pohnpeiensis]
MSLESSDSSRETLLRRAVIVSLFLSWALFGAWVVWWFLFRELTSRVIFVDLNPLESGSSMDHTAFRVALQQELLPWVPAVLLAPFVLWLADRFPLFGKKRYAHSIILLLGGTSFVVFCSLFQDRAARRQPIVAPTPAIETWFPPGLDKTPGGEFGIPLTKAIGRDPQADIPEAFGLPPEVDPRRLPGVIVDREDMKKRIERNWAQIASRSEAALAGLPSAPSSFIGFLDGFIFVALVGFSHAWTFFRTARKENERSALLLLRNAQARALALQAQLQPHFLFNTLNGIAMLVRKNPDAAEEMVTSLSELLRIALDGERKSEIPLREELHFTDRYLGIQRMRFGSRLRVKRSVAPETLDILVPALLIQPLIENAIHHGIEPRLEGGEVRILASLEEEMLMIAIEDDGVGFGKSGAGSGSGIGLKSVRERLSALHPGRHEFRIEKPSGGGVRMMIRLPARLVAHTE